MWYGTENGTSTNPTHDGEALRLVWESINTLLFKLRKVHLLASTVHVAFDHERDRKSTGQTVDTHGLRPAHLSALCQATDQPANARAEDNGADDDNEGEQADGLQRSVTAVRR